EIVVVDRRVHRAVEQLPDRAPCGLQGRELERGSGEEVPPPPRAGNGVEDGLGRELRRDGEAVAVVPHAVAGDRGVDGEEERVESGVGRAVDQTVGDLALLHHVQLVPDARSAPWHGRPRWTWSRGCPA